MEHQACKSMKFFRYILAPEISPEPDRSLGFSVYREPTEKRLLGYVKTVFWILLSIVVSIALGQLN